MSLNHFTLDTISTIVVDATTFCNARCPQCERFDEKNNTIVPSNHLDKSLLFEKVTPLQLPYLKQICFEGVTGDILMHPDALEIAEFYSKFKDLEVRYTTNGSLRNKDFYKNLAKNKNLEIVFSIDGLEDTNYLYRQGTNYKKIMENAKSFIDAGGQARWKFVVFEHNKHQVDEARELSKQLGFRDFGTVYSTRNWYNGNIFPVYKKGEFQFNLKAVDSVTDKPEFFDADKRNLAEKIKNKFLSIEFPIPCLWKNSNLIYLNYTGHIIPCCMLANYFWRETYNTKFFRKLVGDFDDLNLHNHSVEEVLQSKFFAKNFPQSLESKPMPLCVEYCGKVKNKTFKKFKYCFEENLG